MSQIINLLAALLLLLSFGMLSQRRVLALVGLFAAQGALLTVSTLLTAQTSGQAHLYFSAGLTLALKTVVLPLVLRRLVRRLDLAGRAEMLINPTATLLAGIGLVIVAFQVALPLSEFAGTITRGTLGIATACVLLALLMMITRRNAVAQVIGFLSLENGLFFAATSVTYGMPMIVELGIALDVLVGTFVFGVFFFRIRETFDTLDTGRLEKAGDS